MGWVESQGRDLSHHNPVTNYSAARGAMNWVQLKITESDSFVDDWAANVAPNGAVTGPGRHYRGFAGIPRGAYHFARPGSLTNQIRHFLDVKRAIGSWERVDMLDCEFAGVDGAFIRALKDEYRRQSGQRKLLIYLGLYEVTHACPPNQWWDPDVYMWLARYRKIGAPSGPDAWPGHLGFDHPGLSTYQWDNATGLPGAGLTDISYERVAVTTQEADMPLTNDEIERIWRWLIDDFTGPEGAKIEAYMALGRARQDGYEANVKAGRAEAKVDALQAKLDQLLGSGIEFVPSGSVTLEAKPKQ